MTTSSLWRAFLSLALLFIPASATTPTLAQQQAGPARVIIVFDASGSMYGQVEGGVKIDIAKKVVSDIVSTMDADIELGLIAYGHRTKGDCEDIELLVPPKAGSAAEVIKAVTALEPKGKTPLTAAVMQAAQYLKFEENRASVILISDGVETCDQDPCSAADELERMGLDFACHVIGFDLKSGESSGLECLAKKTGGLYLSASDAESLKSSLQTAMKQVTKPETTLVLEAKKSSGGELIEGVTFEVYADGAGEKPTLSGSGGRWSTALPMAGKYTVTARLDGKSLELVAELKDGETVTKEFVFAESGLRAVAFDRDGGTALEKDVSWELNGPADAEGNRQRVAFSYDAKPFLKVAAGTYRLTASKGNASASIDVTVSDGAPQEVTVILGSGNLKLSAISSEGGTAIAQDLAWDFFTPADAEGQRRKLGFSYDAQPTMTLPSGPCLVTVTHGNASASKELMVNAGETQTIVIELGSGTAKLSVVMEEGGTPVAKDVAWDVYGEPDAEGNRVKAAFSYDAEPSLTLPTGKYLVEVAVGQAKGTAPIEITAGATTERVIVLGAGRLKLSAIASDGSTVIASDLGWDVFSLPDAEGNEIKAAFSYDATPTLSLTAGKYVVEVAWGAAKVRSEVQVSGGKLTEATLVLNAGTLDASAVMAPGADPAPTDVTWDVLSEPDAEGEQKKITFSYDAQPKWRLPAGKYILHVVRGGVIVDDTAEVTAGKLTKTQVNLNAGTLRLTSASEGEWEVLGPEDAEGNRKVLYFSYNKEEKIAVPAGKLKVLRKGNDKQAAQEVDIKANTLTDVTLEPK